MSFCSVSLKAIVNSSLCLTIHLSRRKRNQRVNFLRHDVIIPSSLTHSSSMLKLPNDVTFHKDSTQWIFSRCFLRRTQGSYPLRLDTLYAQSYSRSTPVIQYKLVSCLALAHFIRFPATKAQIKTHLVSLTLPKHTNIVCTLLHDKEIASEFVRYLNSRHNNITFTLEFEEDNKIPFLDMPPPRKPDNTFRTSVHIPLR